MNAHNNSITASYALSPMQEAMLFGYILAPESGAYIVQMIGTIREALNISAFRQAWVQMISRHDILRTAFRWEGLEEPRQDVYSGADIPFEIQNWQHFTPEDQKNRFKDFLKTDRKKTIDLSTPPVMRLTLFQFSPTEFKFVWTYNHIIIDGSSHPVFLDELFRYYEANCEGKDISLPPVKTYQEYIKWFQQQDPVKSEGYWRKTLEGFKAPVIFSDLPSVAYFSNNSRTFEEVEVKLSEKTTGLLQDLAQENQVSLNNIVQGVWSLFLSAYCGEADIAFGTVRAGRHWGDSSTESMVGLFIYTLPMRVVITPEMPLIPWLREIKQSQYSMREHETTPLNYIQRYSKTPRNTPLFESILAFLNFDLSAFMQSKGGKWLNREFYISVDNGYPITLYANVKSELVLQIACDKASFSDISEVKRILSSLITLLEAIADDPNRSLGEFKALITARRQFSTGKLPATETPEPEISFGPAETKPQYDKNAARAMARRNTIMRRQQVLQNTKPSPTNQPLPTNAGSGNHPFTKISIAATFTVEPVAETLEFWGKKLERPFKVEFAPYNQVFQQLLGNSTLFSHNNGGMNIVMIRFEDFLGNNKSTPEENAAKVRENVDNLILSLKHASAQSSIPYLVCSCPASPAAQDTYGALFQEMEEHLSASLADTINIHIVRHSELTGMYNVTAYYDSFSDEIGHMPYTSEFFAALGTMIARKLYALYSTPYKVIVLDCDQTLWKGICGEDGPMGIEIDPPRKILQEFMVGQYQAGMLICLCSKNNEEDVNEVFKLHPEMPLKLKHITTSMINWNSKAENLKALAERLDLGMDSFIFIDDNPVECSEVQAFCPDVLTLCLPEQTENIPVFLSHVWAFDHLKITEEDKKRTVLYQQDVQRKNLKEQSISLSDFIAGLGLKLKIYPPTPEHFARIAQLTQRTNQFNLTTIRRSEAEIKELCQSGKLECLITEVSDRFGDYGLVGVVLFTIQADTLKVDTFLLSCRAMGRGVEHRMLANLGMIAKERGLQYVEVPYIPTRKNLPAFDFLEAVSSKYKQPLGDSFICRFPAVYAGAVTYMPDAGKPADSVGSKDGQISASLSTDKQLDKISVKSELFQNIAANLNSAAQISKAIEDESRKQRPETAGRYLAPAGEIERTVTGIWQKVLGIDRVGVDDNFFDIGGTSVKGVLLVSQLNRDFRINLPIVTLFEKPTIRSLAAMLVRETGSRGIIEANLTGQKQN